MELFYCYAYGRLSKEDGDKIESDSIKNQRDLIHSYIGQHTELKLEMEGYVYSVAGRGTFVAEGQEQNLVRRREVEAKVQPLVQELRELGMTEGEWIALWRGGNENA